jgi:hypothetical protein
MYIFLCVKYHKKFRGKTMRFEKQEIVVTHTTGYIQERIPPWIWCENLPEERFSVVKVLSLIL